jgi:hypothetical protein
LAFVYTISWIPVYKNELAGGTHHTIVAFIGCWIRENITDYFTVVVIISGTLNRPGQSLGTTKPQLASSRGNAYRKFM